MAKSDLSGMLKASGHNSIYLTPREWDGSLHADWSVVWVSEGLVRSRARFGVRFPHQHFDDAFRILRPAQAIPEKVSVQHLYKISPLPHGATESAIVEWGRGLQWKLKVLKSLGPEQWLIGSADPPPEGWIGFNGTAILILSVQHRASQPLVLQAGHRALAAAPVRGSSLEAGAENAGAASAGDADPWMAYLRQQGRGPTVPQPSVATASSGTLQQHDRRLQALETTLEEVRAAQASHMSKYEADKQAMSRDLLAMSQQFAQSYDSLHRAQQQQQEQVRAGMEELKHLMLSSRSRSAPDSPKRAKRDAPGPMDSEHRPP